MTSLRMLASVSENNSGASLTPTVPTLVQSTSGSSGGSQNFTVTTPNPPQAGNSLFAFSWDYVTGDILNGVMSQGAFWQKAIPPSATLQQSTAGGGTSVCDLFYALQLNSTPGSTISFQTSASSPHMSVVILEFSGVAALDTVQTYTGSGTVAITPSITPSESNELIFGLVGEGSFGTPGNGFTSAPGYNSAVGGYAAAAYLVNSSTSRPVQATWSRSGSGNYGSAIAAFKSTYTPQTNVVPVANNPYYAANSFFFRPLALGSTDSLQGAGTGAAVANAINYGRQSGYTFQGYSGVGYGYYAWPYSVAWNTSSYSHPVYVVDDTVGEQFVGLVNWSNSALGASSGDLQAYFTRVPIPDISQCPNISGTAPYQYLWADGNDKSCCIWRPSTDEMWEFWGMGSGTTGDSRSQIATNWAQANGFPDTSVDYVAAYAGYIPNVSRFNGVFPRLWGSRACSLGEIGGLITMQDLRNVYAGGGINHAIAIAGWVNKAYSVAPATRADGAYPNGNPVQTIPSGQPGAGAGNPAYQQDITQEAQRWAFPSNVDLTGCTMPLAHAVAVAIRDYGMYNVDTSGVISFYMEDPRTLGSPYHMQGSSAINPFNLNWASVNPGGGNDPRYDNNNVSVFSQIPWSQLQMLNMINS